MDSACIRTRLAAAQGLLAGFETVDREMADHCRRVSTLAARLAVASGLDATGVAEVEIAGLIHDVGKFRVPARILHKPGPLSPGERSLIQEHSEVGAEIVGRIGPLRDFSPLVAHHHERWDGTGYPARLEGEAIPFASRAIAIADAFDAMVQERGYAPVRTVDQARAEILRGAGSQFDPTLARLFVDAVIDAASAPSELLALAA